MQKLIVSFIIPTYNSERTIANCIRSILRQNVEGVEKEIIVVDDCSTDRTVEISRSLGARVILKTLRSGVPESLNLGIQAAKGEIIGLVDSDDYLTDRWLRTCLSKLKEVDGVHTTNMAYQPDKIFRKFAGLALIKGFSIPTLGDASLVKKELFDRIGKFNEWFSPVGGQDFEIALRACKNGFKIVQLSEAKYFHDYTQPTSWRKKIVRTVLYESGRVKAWLMHLDYPPARVGLINDWFWFMFYPLMFLLREIIRYRILR